MRRLLRSVCPGILLFVALQCAFAQTQDSAAKTAASTAAGGVPQARGNITPPRPIYSPDPEYSEEARQKKFQGTCVLWLVVGPDGTPRDIRVQRMLGFGLDEKAIEAVRQWKFEPALKDGKPVAVQINVEVTFRLYSNNKKIYDLEIRADHGDAKADLKLSEAYFQGRDVTKNDQLGYQYLQASANRDLPEAQFLMGEYTVRHTPNDNVTAYMWYALAQRNHYKHSDKKMKELASKMSAENIAEAKARTENWRPSK